LPHTADALHRRSPRPPRRRLVPEMMIQMLPPESWRRWRRRRRRRRQRQRRLPSRRSSRRRHGRLRPSSSLTAPVGGFVGFTLRRDQEAHGRGRGTPRCRYHRLGRALQKGVTAAWAAEMLRSSEDICALPDGVQDRLVVTRHGPSTRVAASALSTGNVQSSSALPNSFRQHSAY
jgi:hypothetical protein